MHDAGGCFSISQSINESNAVAQTDFALKHRKFHFT